ncbi:MAG TPA: undecaprenyl-diphosphate phosphatase, partial [Bacteroidales bacterium]|nr:undecaprenyl-diphosphate phosphatase [Bacteroidales bacterium]
KEEIAKFSFLMVLIPILGENFLDLLSGSFANAGELNISAMLIGFLSAFISGLIACKLMIKIVKRGKLIWFALYCGIVGIITIAVL